MEYWLELVCVCLSAKVSAAVWVDYVFAFVCKIKCLLMRCVLIIVLISASCQPDANVVVCEASSSHHHIQHLVLPVRNKTLPVNPKAVDIYEIESRWAPSLINFLSISLCSSSTHFSSAALFLLTYPPIFSPLLVCFFFFPVFFSHNYFHSSFIPLFAHSPLL